MILNKEHNSIKFDHEKFTFSIAFLYKLKLDFTTRSYHQNSTKLQIYRIMIVLKMKPLH